MKFSDQDIKTYQKAVLFKRKATNLLNELLHNSEKWYLIHERNNYSDQLAWIYSNCLKLLFNLEMKKLIKERYQFKTEEIVKSLDLTKHKLWFLPKSSFKKIYQKLSEERCGVCLENFIQDDKLEDNNYYQHRHHKSSVDFTDILRFGHPIHNDFFYNIYLNSMYIDPGKEILCPYCRDYDPGHFYNIQRLTIIKRWEREDVITTMLENKLEILHNTSINGELAETPVPSVYYLWRRSSISRYSSFYHPTLFNSVLSSLD